MNRILCLGDSSQQLSNTETINIAANGYSTVQELVRLETESVLYEPAHVVLFFCLNDLEDNLDDKDGGRPFARLEDGGGANIANRPVRAPSGNPQELDPDRPNQRLAALCQHLAIP